MDPYDGRRSQSDDALPDAMKLEATPENVFAVLQSMYWKSVEREICNMILAMSEICQLHSEPIESEDYNSTALSLNSKNYRSIFRLWCKCLI